jgi:hypothetical protein
MSFPREGWFAAATGPIRVRMSEIQPDGQIQFERVDGQDGRAERYKSKPLSNHPGVFFPDEKSCRDFLIKSYQNEGFNRNPPPHANLRRPPPPPPPPPPKPASNKKKTG